MDETEDRTEVDGCCGQYDVSRLSGRNSDCRGVCRDPDSGLQAPEGSQLRLRPACWLHLHIFSHLHITHHMGDTTHFVTGWISSFTNKMTCLDEEELYFPDLVTAEQKPQRLEVAEIYRRGLETVAQMSGQFSP